MSLIKDKNSKENIIKMFVNTCNNEQIQIYVNNYILPKLHAHKQQKPLELLGTNKFVQQMLFKYNLPQNIQIAKNYVCNQLDANTQKKTSTKSSIALFIAKQTNVKKSNQNVISKISKRIYKEDDESMLMYPLWSTSISKLWKNNYWVIKTQLLGFNAFTHT